MSGINSAQPAGEVIPINGAGGRIVVWPDGGGITLTQASYREVAYPARDLPALLQALERAAASLGIVGQNEARDEAREQS